MKATVVRIDGAASIVWGGPDPHRLPEPAVLVQRFSDVISLSQHEAEILATPSHWVDIITEIARGADDGVRRRIVTAIVDQITDPVVLRSIAAHARKQSRDMEAPF